MEKLKLDKYSLKKFGITMGITLLAISMFILFRHKHNALPTLFASGIFLILAIASPGLLRPVYVVWMKLAFMLGWVNTRFILFILFYLIFTPIGLAVKLFGVDLLDRKIDKNKESYWHKHVKSEFNPLNYERQF